MESAHRTHRYRRRVRRANCVARAVRPVLRFVDTDQRHWCRHHDLIESIHRFIYSYMGGYDRLHSLQLKAGVRVSTWRRLDFCLFTVQSIAKLARVRFEW